MMRLGILLISCILSIAGMMYVPRAGKSVRPEMSVLAVEDRDGYECRYVEFAVGKDDGGKERIRAYLLVPEGGSKHPAVLMLHDHGARFDIGKEKLVRMVDPFCSRHKQLHVHLGHVWRESQLC